MMLHSHHNGLTFLNTMKMSHHHDVLDGGSASTFNVTSVVNANVPSLHKAVSRFIVGSVPSNNSDFNNMSTA
jgi:hypothetical protein